MGIELINNGIMVTEEDILSLVNVGNSEGVIEDEKRNDTFYSCSR